MKTIIAAGLLLACSATWTAAQSPPGTSDAARVDAVRQAVRTDKRALVEKNMQLTAEEAKKFWPLYDAYQRDLDPILQRQNRSILDYINTESSMTDANAKRIANDVLAADADEQKLRERLMSKMLKALPARKAVRYMQIENKIRSLNRFDIAVGIPLVH
jgi:parvulin-like peptidyl-prolyl isomerase